MTQSEIQKARQTDLAGYLLSVGVPLVRQGSRYQHAEHDSLVFTKNAYYWNSRQEHGNAIDYLMRHMGFDFKSAVNALVVADGRLQPNVEPKKFALSVRDDFSKVKNYLNQTRSVGNSVIDFLSENKLLFQEKQSNNAVFPMYDENNIIVGAELQGITSKRFKGVQAGSKYGYGFNVRFSENNSFDFALFFESAVDLISFMDFKRHHDKKSLDGCLLVSMAGLKINVLRHTLKAFRGDLKVVLCVDNDEAGRKFKNDLEGAKVLFRESTPDSPFKDWNEQLIAWRGRKPINRLMEQGKKFR